MPLIAKCANILAAVLLLESLSTSVSAEVVVLSVGSDRSFDKRTKPLQYAASDAKSFADTMVNVGAVPKSMVSLGRNLLLEEFESSLKSGLDRLKASADQSKNKFVFFFSGHADERGLHFRDGYFSKESLDRFIAKLPAKTKVLIIDSCFAGLLSTKGVKATKGFGAPKLNFDEPSGSIYLTASSGSEFAYESQKLRGGLFSHNVIDGLHGKADTNGDGVVTATELYEYAFRETRLTSRIISMPGEQNPEFVANLQGRGAVALSFPVLAKGNIRMMSDLGGKINLYASKGLNTFEHTKMKGIDDTISLPTGDYQIEVVDGKNRGMGQIRVASTSTTLVTRDDMTWNSTPSTSPEVRSRGIEADLKATPEGGPRQMELSSGLMGRARYTDVQIALTNKKSSGWHWPIWAVDFIENTGTADPTLHNDLKSSRGILAGVGVPILSHSYPIDGNVYAGVKSVEILSRTDEHWHGDSSMSGKILPVLRFEARISTPSRKAFFAVGHERPVLVPKNLSLSNQGVDFVVARLGLSVPM